MIQKSRLESRAAAGRGMNEWRSRRQGVAARGTRQLQSHFAGKTRLASASGNEKFHPQVLTGRSLSVLYR